MGNHPLSSRRSKALCGSAIAALVTTSALVWIQLSIGCDPISDQFQCGLRREDDPKKARICDQPAEVCICGGENRCALPDPSCPGSGLRFSFSPRDCVDAGIAGHALPQSDMGATFCPGADGKCGQPGGSVCPQNQACACAKNECAEEVDTAECDGGFRYVGSRECVPAKDTRPEVLLFWQGGADGGGTLCPEYLPQPPPCGVQMPGQAMEPCDADAGEICVCAGDRFRCAFRAPSCGASGYAWSKSHGCVGDLTKTDIEDPKSQVNAAGLCPQYAQEDAGTDAADASDAPDAPDTDDAGDASDGSKPD